MEMTDDLMLKTTAGSKRTNSEHKKSEDGPQNRPKIVVEAPLKKEPDGPRRSSQFYYSDGTIILVVGGVEPVLIRSGSAIRAGCSQSRRRRRRPFQSLSLREPRSTDEDADTMSENDHLQTVDSTEIPRYELRVKNITVADFTVFLCAFENPLMHVITPCSQSTVVSLLRVATKLECGTVHKVAKHRLCALWPPTAPSNSRRRKNLNETTDIIAVARELDLPEVLKRAFYELLRNPSFWDMLVNKRANVKLPDADVITLYHARHILQQEWRALALTPPSPESVCLGTQGQQRCASSIPARSAGRWQSHFVQTGDLEKGALDPVCYVDVILEGPLFKRTEGPWCSACLAERKAAWEGAKARWWDMLDGLFKIETEAESNAAEPEYQFFTGALR